MKQMIRAITGQRERTGAFDGWSFTGWEYDEGWLVRYTSPGHVSSSVLWVDGSFASPRFSSASEVSSDGQIPSELVTEPMEADKQMRSAVLGMLWEWEVWEPITVAGTCAIESLTRMLEVSRDTLLNWFRAIGHDPSVPEQIIQTLESNGYAVVVEGPEGFGKFHEHHRLVSVFRKDDPRKGHVVLVYEYDRDIFDSSGVFKNVGDILWSDRLGYNRGPVWRIEKRS